MTDLGWINVGGESGLVVGVGVETAALGFELGGGKVGRGGGGGAGEGEGGLEGEEEGGGELHFVEGWRWCEVVCEKTVMSERLMVKERAVMASVFVASYTQIRRLGCTLCSVTKAMRYGIMNDGPSPCLP